jgi:hypothetical protein
MAKEQKFESPKDSRLLPNPLGAENKLKFRQFCADTKVQRGTHCLQPRSEDENAL